MDHPNGEGNTDRLLHRSGCLKGTLELQKYFKEFIKNQDETTTIIVLGMTAIPIPMIQMQSKAKAVSFMVREVYLPKGMAISKNLQ